MPKRRSLHPVYCRNPRAGEEVKFDHDFPPGFILCIDTREQDPLFKNPPRNLLIKRCTLPSGDYSCDGWELSISMERKSIPDLFKCLGNDRKRFSAELERLSSYQFKALIIEGNDPDVLRWQEFSQMHPNSVRWSLVAIQQKYCPGIHIHYGPRHDLERYVLDNLVYYYRQRRLCQ